MFLMNAQYSKIDPPVDLTLVNHPGLVAESLSRKKGRRWWLLALLVFMLFFTPMRTTVLVLGVDRSPEDTWQGRSDTMILTSISPVASLELTFSAERATTVPSNWTTVSLWRWPTASWK